MERYSLITSLKRAFASMKGQMFAFAVNVDPSGSPAVTTALCSASRMVWSQEGEQESIMKEKVVSVRCCMNMQTIMCFKSDLDKRRKRTERCMAPHDLIRKGL